MNETKKMQQRVMVDPDLNQAKKTVLVVEDDRTHLALMDKILKNCKFKTVLAENGVIALSKIDAGQCFDLILMDWDMPELNGLETAKAIRTREVNNGSPHTPIIAFTANNQKGDREQCLAVDGREALSTLQEKHNTYDIIFMDWQMPVMDSHEAIREIRKKDWGQNLKIIALTANAIQGDREKCIEAGADDYMSKPLRVFDVIQALQKHFPDKCAKAA